MSNTSIGGLLIKRVHCNGGGMCQKFQVVCPRNTDYTTQCCRCQLCVDGPHTPAHMSATSSTYLRDVWWQGNCGCFNVSRAARPVFRIKETGTKLRL